MNEATLTNNGVSNHLTVEHVLSGGKTLQDILSKFQVTVTAENQEEMLVELTGLEAPVANALRRIMLAEVPTMAIEDVHLYQNTSAIPDEVLAHRLGLIPIKADPRHFTYKATDAEFSPGTSICFKLHCVCKRDAEGNVTGANVYSGDLQWVPLGGQETVVRPVLEDILLAKLGPGQEIEAELYCEKGVGKTHAKWSPVCTAAYKLLPIVRLRREVKGAEARALKEKCPMNVFDIEDGALQVAALRNCTSCRECIREDDSLVELGKVKDHFICNH